MFMVNSNKWFSSSQLDGEFLWAKPTQGLVLGAFFWGYLVTQIPGGLMAERWGGRHVLGWAMFITAVATILTPVGATVSPILLIVLRVVKGLGEVGATLHLKRKSNTPPPADQTLATLLPIASQFRSLWHCYTEGEAFETWQVDPTCNAPILSFQSGPLWY